MFGDLLCDRKSTISPKESKLHKGKVLPFNYFSLITSDRKPPGSDPAEPTCVKMPSARAHHTSDAKQLKLHGLENGCS